MKKTLTKIFLVLVIIMNLVSLSSCISKAKEYANEKLLEILYTIRVNRDISKFNDRKIAEEQMELFCTALKDNDKDSIKEMFSEKAINDCGNVDEQINDILSRFGGNIQSWEYDCMSSSGNVEYGTYTKAEIWATGYFECNEETYRVEMHIYPIDINEPDNIGIYNVCLIDKKIDKEMHDRKREIIKHDEMEKHPIIWVLDLTELEG